MIWSLIPSIAAIGTGFMSTLCCVGPATLQLVGLNGSDIGPWFAEYRLYNVTATLLLLAFSYYIEYGNDRENSLIENDDQLAKKRNWGKIFLWVSYGLIIFFKLTPEVIMFVYNF